MSDRPPASVRLRGGTLVTAPLGLGAMVAAAVGLSVLLWILGTSPADPTTGWVVVGIAGALSGAGFLAAAGCRVEVADGVVNDVVAWRTVARIPCSSIRTVRVRAGLWRTFEVETDDGERRVLLGAGPLQFPTNRLPGAKERDLERIDVLMDGS